MLTTTRSYFDSRGSRRFRRSLLNGNIDSPGYRDGGTLNKFNLIDELRTQQEPPPPGHNHDQTQNTHTHTYIK